MSDIMLLDGSLKLRIFYDSKGFSFDDDICLSFTEDCPDDEKLFKADITSIYLTSEEAGLLILELNRVLHDYRHNTV